MNAKPFYDVYTRILCEELKPALGCTEPVAIAYASATAVAALEKEPEKLVVSCSGNVVKNVKGVTVPNSGGMKALRRPLFLELSVAIAEESSRFYIQLQKVIERGQDP